MNYQAPADKLVERIYEDFNLLEQTIDGEAASVEQTTLAKLREVYLRARRRGDDKLYAQAFRVYNRLLNSEDLQQQQPNEYAERFAHHIVDIVLRVMQEQEWFQRKTPEDISRLVVWLTEVLRADFEERIIFEP